MDWYIYIPVPWMLPDMDILLEIAMKPTVAYWLNGRKFSVPLRRFCDFGCIGWALVLPPPPPLRNVAPVCRP